ncbi:ARM repeat-containing protein [Phellopilus nigrolimitatus]|nr:ARM repeat-containing protein [Phellopilus nigrolimitatus]
MGIIVSWINTIWTPSDSKLTDPHGPSSPIHNQAQVDPSTHKARPTSSASQLDHPAPPLPSPQALPPPSSYASADNRQSLYVSSDYDERARPAVMSMSDVNADSNADRVRADAAADRARAPASPPALTHSPLRINVAAANDPAMDREIEMVDASFVSPGVPDPSEDLCFDDEGLSALEKIYLFARSNASFHRVFIARSLPTFLPDVVPAEAVEYVIPLMNGLAMDEEDAVKEALVEDLVSSIWWFLTHCQVVDFEVPEEADPRDIPLLYVQTFTPLLGTLLLNPGSNIGAPARRCIVNLLTRLREADAQGSDVQSLGPVERRLFKRELLQQVVIGMGHLEPANGWNGASDAGEHSNTAQDSHSDSITDDSAPPLSLADTLSSPPLSAADDEMMLATFSSTAALALATTQFLVQEEPMTPRPTASIQRPPSPLPSSPNAGKLLPLPDGEPELTKPIPQPLSIPMSISGSPVPGSAGPTSPASPASPASPMTVETTGNWETGSSRENATREHVMSNAPQLTAPQPQPVHEPGVKAAEDTDVSQLQLGADGSDSNEFSEEQAAIGRLASMSLMAAVTASGTLDQDSQLAFVKEIQRAGRDPVYWVRREATFALGALAKVVPVEILYLYLLPLFEYFCEDIVWNVRQSVLFSLPAILSRLPFDSRRTHALRMIQRLSVDPSPQVRTGVLEVLGEIIFSFREDEKGPPGEIVRLFIGEEGRDWRDPEASVLDSLDFVQSRNPWANSIFRSRLSTASGDSFGRQSPSISPLLTPNASNTAPESDPARPLICAFNLPAVILTLGPARWPELRGLYLFLARSNARKVRQTLAASIGEIARIIGPVHARRDLMYRWWDFVRGRDAEVRMKALEALEVLLQTLDAIDRARLVGSLEEIWDNHLSGWREREVLAARLDKLAPLFPNNGEALQKLLRRALRDNTAAVRNAAVEAYPHIYDCISAHPEVLRSVVNEILSLAYEQSFRRRLTYVECIKSLILHHLHHERIMDESFWQAALALASDKIVDVRIGVARLLSIVCDKIISQFRTLPAGVLEIVRTLAEDPSDVVRAFVTHIVAGDRRPLLKDVHKRSTETPPASAAMFSRPPPGRHRQSLVSGIGELKITDAFREQEQPPGTPQATR